MEAADGLYAEMDDAGMIAGGGAPSSLVWAAPALEGAMAASDGVKSLLSEVQDAAERAAMFDPSYYPKAADAYANVLKLDPDDLPALRGVGNID